MGRSTRGTPVAPPVPDPGFFGDDLDPETAALIKQLQEEDINAAPVATRRERKAPEVYKPPPPGVGGLAKSEKKEVKKDEPRATARKRTNRTLRMTRHLVRHAITRMVDRLEGSKGRPQAMPIDRNSDDEAWMLPQSWIDREAPPLSVPPVRGPRNPSPGTRNRKARSTTGSRTT